MDVLNLIRRSCKSLHSVMEDWFPSKYQIIKLSNLHQIKLTNFINFSLVILQAFSTRIGIDVSRVSERLGALV